MRGELIITKTVIYYTTKFVEMGFYNVEVQIVQIGFVHNKATVMLVKSIMLYNELVIAC